MKVEFKSYNGFGKLVDYTWATSPATIVAETEAYQDRLNRREIFWVDVWSDDPETKHVTLYPRKA